MIALLIALAQADLSNSQSAPPLARDAVIEPMAPLPGPHTVGAIDLDRLNRCRQLILDDNNAALAEAHRWIADHGGWPAQQCLGLTLSAAGRFAEAADAFEAGAAAAGDQPTWSATLWAQAGSAALAARHDERARRDLDAAANTRHLSGAALTAVYLDRARAAVRLDDPTAARGDIDRATAESPQDATAWLLSATLARRMGDLAHAAGDINTALRLAPADARIALEAGNIAAETGHDDEAQRQWRRVLALASQDPEGTQVAASANANMAALGASPTATQPSAPSPSPSAPAPASPH